MSPPDVTLIGPYPPAGELHGGHSGVASYTANLARALAARGASVEVVAASVDGDPDEFDDGDVHVRREFELGRHALPQAARAVSRGERRPDVVHLQWELFLYGGPRSLPGLFPALARLGAPGTSPLVATLHQVVDPVEIDRGYTHLHRVGAPPVVARLGLTAVQRALRHATDATIVHEAPFEELLPGAVVIPHGIEQVPRPDRATARAALGLDDRLVVLCFGFVAPYKGLETAIDAAAVAGDGVQLVVAGGTHPRLEEAGYVEELRARHPGVARFTGRVPDDEVATWFAAADVALFPYPKPFSSSGALALALALGTPVLLSPALATCVGAPAALRAPADAATLGALLRDLAGDGGAQARRELATWTALLAGGRAWPDVADRHLELYEEVTRADRAAHRRLRAG